MGLENNMEFSKRKWGWYLTIIDKKNFKVKILRFHKGKQCSFQRHFFRNEVWCFLSGEGNLYSGKNFHSVFPYKSKEGMSFLVPKEYWHQYKAKKNTTVLEIQFGKLCDESDIERA